MEFGDMSDSSIVLERENVSPNADENLAASYAASSTIQNERQVPTSYEALRSSPRNKYSYNQRVAPMLGKSLPSVSEYLEVECNDISRGGISFFLKRDPTCKHFVIALGQKPNINAMLAEVCYTKPAFHDGQLVYQVGCKFVGKIDLTPAERKFFGCT
jgi:hypothetical protein